MADIDYFFTALSPYTYLAGTRLEEIAARHGASIAYKPQEGQSEARADKVSDSADIDQHTKTNAIKLHHGELDANNNFTKPDEWISTEDEPDHQELCEREQALFLDAILNDTDLTDSMADAVSSLRIVLAAQQSIDEERAITLQG